MCGTPRPRDTVDTDRARRYGLVTNDDFAADVMQEFDAALRSLSQARIADEDEPRHPDRVTALGAARVRLDEPRAAMDDERSRLGLDAPWRVVPAPVDQVEVPPLWSVDHRTSA